MNCWRWDCALSSFAITNRVSVSERVRLSDLVVKKRDGFGHSRGGEDEEWGEGVGDGGRREEEEKIPTVPSFLPNPLQSNPSRYLLNLSLFKIKYKYIKLCRYLYFRQGQLRTPATPHVQSACTKGWIAQRGENTSFFFDVLQRYVWTQIDKTSSAADQTHGCTSSLKDYDAIVDCFIDNSFSGENGE